MTVPLAEQLADFVVATRDTGPPDDVIASTRQRLLDVLGLSVAARSLATSQSVVDVVSARGGTPQATAIGVDHRLPAPAAAFVNGVLAHSLDYDDTHLPSVLHPSASVVPAALAMAETCDADGATLLAGTAAGIEVVVRLGMAGYDETSRNSLFFEHGQHATSICGAVGAAAAAAAVAGLDAERIRDAIGIAVSMGAGVIEANRTGGTVKRIHCGWAAQSGVTAAELARAGITGPPTALEGRFGFFQAWLHGRGDTDAVTSDLGRHWAVPEIFFKPYPANHFTHTSIDAAIRLRERGVTPHQIEALHLGVAAPTVRTIGEPLAAKQAPETGYQGQFSGPYAVTAALFGGHGLGVGLEDFTDDLVRCPDRRVLMGRVTVGPDERCNAIYPYQFPVVLTARLQDGSQLEEAVLANRGGSERPLSDGELARKFDDNVSRALTPEIAAGVRHVCEKLPAGRPADLLSPLRELVSD